MVGPLPKHEPQTTIGPNLQHAYWTVVSALGPLRKDDRDVRRMGMLPYIGLGRDLSPVSCPVA